MVSLISIGIEKYKNRGKDSLEDINCAYTDAKKVYGAFENALGNSMRKHASMCLRDISALECRVLLSALELSIEGKDIFLLYFSGHGIVESNGKLKLVFSDYGYAEKKGTIELGEIISILKDYKCRIILILDCCYSGAGLAESGKDDPKLEQSISILSSNGAIGRARYTEEGSEFTTAVCKGLVKLCNDQEDISLNNIYKKVSDGYKNCKVIIGGGKEDIVLKKKHNESLPSGFEDAFYKKLSNVDYEMREALWYSAGYLPIVARGAILDAYHDRSGESYFAEMSWRVRRAMGSVLPFGANEKIDKYIWKFLKADSWMEKCIGYISVRKNLNPEIRNLMQRELENRDGSNPMDLIWLIALYLSDDTEASVEKLILDSNLLKSVWGATEVWKRYFKDKPLEDKLNLFKEKLDSRMYKQLCLELYLRGEIPDISNDILAQVQEHVDNIRELYSGKVRGRIGESQNNKWIYSILYGNWRDQVDINEIMEKILRPKRPTYKNKFLKALRYVPSVEIRMAVLDFFATKVKLEKYSVDIEALEWALSDEHPWVVRTALPLFRDKKELVQKNLRKEVNMDIYPGVFDLSIELIKQGFDEIKYEIKNMTNIEKSQLEWAQKRERKL